jgi:hypothetical protein
VRTVDYLAMAMTAGYVHSSGYRSEEEAVVGETRKKQGIYFVDEYSEMISVYCGTYTVTKEEEMT